MTDTIFKIDMSGAIPTATTVQLSTDWLAADFTQIGDYLWGVTANGGSNGSQPEIQRLDPISGEVTTFSRALGDMNAGAAFTFGNGNLGFSDSINGTVTQVKITDPESATPTFTVVSKIKGPASARNDGTTCIPNPWDADLQVTKTGPAVAAAGSSIT